MNKQQILKWLNEWREVVESNPHDEANDQFAHGKRAMIDLLANEVENRFSELHTRNYER